MLTFLERHWNSFVAQDECSSWILRLHLALKLQAVKVLRRHIITKPLVKESESPGEHPVLGIHAKVLEELKVRSKPAKVKGKPGKRKQKVAVAVF